MAASQGVGALDARIAREPSAWLTKTEVNSIYYNTVAGEIAFDTEAQAGLHARAVARLIGLHARRAGRRRLRILEIGANDCTFARALLQELDVLAGEGSSGLERIDYVAVEYARDSLEAAAAWEEARSPDTMILRPREPAAGARGEPEQPVLVALLRRAGLPAVNLALVHAEANQFVGGTDERFDLAIVNEVLDDMPYRAYYADADGRRHEAVAHSRLDGGRWTVRVAARPVDDDAASSLRPGTLTAHSAEAVELVQGISGVLEVGGMLLMHDYGFADGAARLDLYESQPGSVPPFVTLEFPEGSDRGFPRSFFRVFGNEWHEVVQLTNDVNFAEIAAALEATGTVTVLAHGNTIVNRPDGPPLVPGDGVFLSEFLFLEPHDDLPGRLARLNARQAELRERYVREHMGGRNSIFLDLLYLKGDPAAA